MYNLLKSRDKLCLLTAMIVVVTGVAVMTA